MEDKKYELVIIYDKEMEELKITNNNYDYVNYIKIDTKDKILKAIKDYLEKEID